MSSSFLRMRVTQSIDELRGYERRERRGSSSLRHRILEEVDRLHRDRRRSSATAPARFPNCSAVLPPAKAVPPGVVSVNPHNQFFAVAIQLGLIGGAILIAMWLAHLALFRGGG